MTKFRIYFASFLCIIASCNEDSQWLKCKPRQGCSIAQCEPGHSESDEYSVLCQENKEPSSGIISKQNEMFREIIKLEGRLERAEDEIDELKDEVRDLEEKNSKMQSQMEESSDRISNLEKENSEMQGQLTKQKETNKELLGRIVKLEEFLKKMYPDSTDVPGSLSCEEGFLYREKCYFAIIGKTWVWLQKATDMCKGKGATRADVLNLEHQKLVADHVRTKSKERIYVWLGMSYAVSTSTLRWSNGKEIPKEASLEWYSGYPSPYAIFNTIVLRVEPDKSGIYNETPHSNRNGVVCEKKAT